MVNITAGRFSHHQSHKWSLLKPHCCQNILRQLQSILTAQSEDPCWTEQIILIETPPQHWSSFIGVQTGLIVQWRVDLWGAGIISGCVICMHDGWGHGHLCESVACWSGHWEDTFLQGGPIHKPDINLLKEKEKNLTINLITPSSIQEGINLFLLCTGCTIGPWFECVINVKTQE